MYARNQFLCFQSKILNVISLDASIVLTYQHSAGTRKDTPPNEIGHSHGGTVAKIHAVADAYSYPVYIVLSKSQRNDIHFAFPVLEHINIEGGQILADRGYDNNQLIDYIYDHGGEPTILSRKGAKFHHLCDWQLYKERHLVEKLFLKLKSYEEFLPDMTNSHLTYLPPFSFHYLSFIPRVLFRANSLNK